MVTSLAQFIGDWSLTRQIEDRASGQPARFDGQARFDPVPDGLHYVETGVLRVADQQLTATRHYRWRSDGPDIAVSFDDGRPFHRIALGQPTPTDHHDCAPDTYRVAYDFSAFPDWTATWTVTGPRKDYTAITRYLRA